MRRYITILALIALAACSKTKDITPKNEYKDKEFNIAELVSFIGKPYSEVENAFEGVRTRVTSSLGDKTVETSIKITGSPITTFSCTIEERNGKIAHVFLESKYAGHNRNKDAFMYIDNLILKTYAINSVAMINTSGGVYIGVRNRDEAYTYWRNNPDYGAFFTYKANNVTITLACLHKSYDAIAIQIE